jgi:hypothetical protein
LGDKPAGVNPTPVKTIADWVGRLRKLRRFYDVV